MRHSAKTAISSLRVPLMRLGTHQKITLAVVTAALLPLTVAAIGAYGTQRLLTNVRSVTHTHEVRRQILGVARHIDAAKGDIRGHLLTGDSAYLRRHVANVERTEAAFERASRLTSDNPDQARRLAALRDVLNQREAALEQTVALSHRPEWSDSTLVARLAVGQTLASRLDSILNVADSAEAALLARRSRDEESSERFLTGTAFVLVVSGVGLGLLFRSSIIRDLSGRARAEAELRASEAKFAGIMDIAVDAVITIDEQRRIVHFNRGAEAIFGYDRAEALGRPAEMLLPERYRDTHPSHVRDFAAAPEGARRMGERRIIAGRHKDGREFPAEASISKLATPDGLLFTAVLRDVTESRRREQHEHALALAGPELTKSLAYHDVVTTIARLPVPSVGAWCILDLFEEEETGERVLRRVAGVHIDTPMAGTLAELERLSVDLDSPEPAIDALGNGQVYRIVVDDDWLEGHTPTPAHFELMQRLASHSLLVVPITGRDATLGAWTIGSQAGRPFDEHDQALALALAQRAAATLQNARSYQTTQSAIAARDSVLGVVSHDLRNPISAISMLAQNLVDDAALSREIHSTGKSILAAADWMNRLIRDLLDASSIEAGRLAVEVEPLAVSSILEACLQMFVEQAAAKGVTLVTALPPHPQQVLGDGARLVQVLGNLVGNALKFSPSGATIEIGAGMDGPYGVFWVRDNGPGIPAAEVPWVFDRFWHARRGSAKRGHGLGLAICQGIVKAHGGRVWVESVIDERTTFFFTVPLAVKAAFPADAEPARQYSPTLSTGARAERREGVALNPTK